MAAFNLMQSLLGGQAAGAAGAANVGAAGAGGGGLSNLLQNKLFLQYLSGAGQDIASGNPIGENVNQITQQNIKAQNYAKMQQRQLDMVSKMLSGEVPEDGKMEITSDGLSLKIPKSALDTTGSTGGTSGSQALDKTGGTSNLGFLNPSESSAISGADLAGLTPTDISQALQDALSVEEFKQSSIASLMEASKPAEVDKDTEPYPIPHHAAGEMTTYEWKQLPTIEQEYSAYTHASKLAGDENVMSMDEFKNVDPTTRAQFLRELQEDPGLLSTAERLAQAGATQVNLGDVAGKERVKGEVKQELSVTDPEFTSEVDEKYDRFSAYEHEGQIQSLMAEYGLSEDEAASQVRKALVRQDIDRQVRQAYRGRKVERRPDGWYVDGELTVRDPYAK